MKLHRYRPSPAMVVALIALFVSLGGVGIAATKIGTRDLRNGAVTAKKLHKNAVTTKKIKNSAVTGAKIATASVQEDELADGAVTEGKLGDAAVTEGKLADGGVTNGKLGAQAVTGDKVAADTLTGDNIDESSLGLVPGAQNALNLRGEDARHYKTNCYADDFKRASADPLGVARVNGDAAGFPSTFTSDGNYVIGDSCSAGTGPFVEARRISAGRFQIRFPGIFSNIGLATVDSTSGAGGTGLDDFATITPSGAGWEVFVRDADGGFEDADFYFLML